MKLLLIAYNEALDEKVENMLRENGLEGFTKWTRVYGKGRTSGPHLGTHVWPKANNVRLIAVEDDGVASNVIQAVRQLRATLGHEGIKAFAVPLAEMT